MSSKGYCHGRMNVKVAYCGGGWYTVTSVRRLKLNRVAHNQ